MFTFLKSAWKYGSFDTHIDLFQEKKFLTLYSELLTFFRTKKAIFARKMAKYKKTYFVVWSQNFYRNSNLFEVWLSRHSYYCSQKGWIKKIQNTKLAKFRTKNYFRISRNLLQSDVTQRSCTVTTVAEPPCSIPSEHTNKLCVLYHVLNLPYRVTLWLLKCTPVLMYKILNSIKKYYLLGFVITTWKTFILWTAYFIIILSVEMIYYYIRVLYITIFVTYWGSVTFPAINPLTEVTPYV
jgi:hypothetical protein